MSKNEASKVVLVTGASSGFGKHIAARLIAEGHIIYPAARRLDEMEALKTEHSQPIRLDVTDEALVRERVGGIIADHGRIDVLINNAGYGIYDLIESCDIARARAEFDVNFWGVAILTQAVVPHMRKLRSGRIINMSSGAGRVSGPMIGWYSASKFALEAFSDALRIEVGQFGIKVSLVEPGIFKTGFGDVVTSHFAEIECDDDYRSLVDAYVAGYSQRQKAAPSPEPVIEAVLDAVFSETPQTRYLVGDDANALVANKASMTDEEFDAVIKRYLRIE